MGAVAIAETIETQYAELSGAFACWWADVGREWPLETVIEHVGPIVITERRNRVDARFRLEADEQSYMANPNPLYVWFAILDARAAGMPLPSWVVNYLEGVAHRFLEIAHARIRRDKRPGRVAEALGLKPKEGPGRPARHSQRRRDAFEKLMDPMPGVQLAFDLWMERSSRTHEDARDHVAQKHEVSESAVDRAWRAWKDYVVPERLRGWRLKSRRPALAARR